MKTRDILFAVTFTSWVVLLMIGWFVALPVSLLWFFCGWVSCAAFATGVEVVRRARSLRSSS